MRLYVCMFWDVVRSGWRQGCLAGSFQVQAGGTATHSFIPWRRCRKPHSPKLQWTSGWEEAYLFRIYFYVCIYIYIHIIFLCVYTYCMYSYVFHTSFILCISETWKVLYWNSNCRIIILVKRSVEKNWKGKVELSECIYSNWLMYIILYLSIHVCNTVTYLVVNLKIFDVHTDTERWSRARWPPRLGFLSNIGCVKLWGCWTNTKG